ncbi:eukaryotic rRNA processing protein EBP2-domain-containing protein [Fusarium tricinctum]|uniref:Eukaryotic rRNA processing protein EBP2-domain-containing protein n=1 Tax=Fusarium tricinctum TaxID=61284 RepID=A0A8K0RX69_9HYPO|nr:eukaryotic rRNA processing protein EBP2-domain-containing protein [Fusarium tricinctum]
MVTKGKLKMALAAEKGTDFKKLKLLKKQKEAEKRNAAARGAEDKELSDDEEKTIQIEAEFEDDDDEEDEDEEEEEEEAQYDLNGINDSDDSDSSIELEEKIVRTPKRDTLKKSEIQKLAAEKKAAAEEDDEEEEEDEEDIPMSDLEDLDDEDKEDIIPHQRLTINNTTALLAALNRISIPTDKSVPFSAHQSLLSSAATAESIPDVQDDLQRELAFYSQSLEAARSARKLLRQEGVPFSRPKDYFAEMIKEDAHMEKVKAKLVEEASNKKAAQEARKMRDLKKFGKQVQVAKIQERHKAKRETLDKIKNLKRKRSESGGAGLDTKEADIFDVGVEKEMKGHNSRSGAGRGQGAKAGGHKRAKKDEKYGFGGKKRHAKSGDAMSSGDLSGFDPKKMKAGSRVSKSRPGKARRKAIGSR